VTYTGVKKIILRKELDGADQKGIVINQYAENQPERREWSEKNAEYFAFMSYCAKRHTDLRKRGEMNGAELKCK